MNRKTISRWIDYKIPLPYLLGGIFLFVSFCFNQWLRLNDVERNGQENTKVIESILASNKDNAKDAKETRDSTIRIEASVGEIRRMLLMQNGFGNKPMADGR
ncbi:hypothetical protein [Methylobacterium sp. Gmos1]